MKEPNLAVGPCILGIPVSSAWPSSIPGPWSLLVQPLCPVLKQNKTNKNLRNFEVMPRIAHTEVDLLPFLHSWHKKLMIYDLNICPFWKAKPSPHQSKKKEIKTYVHQVEATSASRVSMNFAENQCAILRSLSSSWPFPLSCLSSAFETELSKHLPSFLALLVLPPSE